MDNSIRIETEKSFMEVSRGAARSRLYALRAEQESQPRMAQLFRAMACSQEAQATRFLIQLRGQIAKNEQNCIVAFNEEIPALIDHFQQAQELAAATKERALEGAFSHSAKVSRIFLALKKRAEKDLSHNSSYHVCSFCGFIMEGKSPATCPVCTAPKERFQCV